jgi:hypothetical protein
MLYASQEFWASWNFQHHNTCYFTKNAITFSIRLRFWWSWTFQKQEQAPRKNKCKLCAMCSSYVTTQILDFWLVWAPETCQTIHVTSLLTVQHTYTQDKKGYISISTTWVVNIFIWHLFSIYLHKGLQKSVSFFLSKFILSMWPLIVINYHI